MKTLTVRKSEEGSVTVVALVILALLGLIGVAISRTASLEIRIAGNERAHKVALYEADAGVEVGAELLELNIACSQGFSATEANGDALIENAAVVKAPSLAFWTNASASTPSDAAHDFHLPNAFAAGEPHTNISVGGSSFMGVGGSILPSSGYEGSGKGGAGGGGGVFMLYDIIARHEGRNNSQATVMLQWRHVVGQEGQCLY